MKRARKCFGWAFLLLVLILLVVANNIYEIYPVHLFKDNEQREVLRLMTYNVHSGSSLFSRHSKKMAAMISGESPDFLYLTEYYEGADESLHNFLSQHFPYVDRKHSWGVNEGDAFYSKWEIDSVMRYNMLWHYSTVFRVQIHHKTDTLAIYCCHLSSNNQILEEGRWASMEEGRRLRCEEADVIVEALQNERHTAIVMGDMNDFSFAEPIKRIKSVGMSDAWWSGGTGYGSTYCDGMVRLRIDHVLYNKHQMKLRNISVVGDYEWSDHRAILAELSFANLNSNR